MNSIGTVWQRRYGKEDWSLGAFAMSVEAAGDDHDRVFLACVSPTEAARLRARFDERFPGLAGRGRIEAPGSASLRGVSS